MTWKKLRLKAGMHKQARASVPPKTLGAILAKSSTCRTASRIKIWRQTMRRLSWNPVTRTGLLQRSRPNVLRRSAYSVWPAEPRIWSRRLRENEARVSGSTFGTPRRARRLAVKSERCHQYDLAMKAQGGYCPRQTALLQSTRHTGLCLHNAGAVHEP